LTTYQVIKKIPKKLVKELQSILDIKEGYYEGAGRDEIIYVICIGFPNNIEAEIKVCNGNTPYVDPVLFEVVQEKTASGETINIGVEVGLLDVRDELLGEYHFEYNGDKYIVKLIEGE